MPKPCCQCRVTKLPTDYYKGDAYCKSCRQSRSNSYYKRNQSEIKSRHAEYSKINAVKRRKIASDWASANRHRRAEIWAAYYASKLRAMPAWANREAIEAIYKEARRVSQMTGIAHHVDHIVPLQGETVCGLHVHCNLQVITALDNARKRNKFAT